MKFSFKLTQKITLLFSLAICLNTSAYADLSTIFINSAAFTIGYSINPLSWVAGAIGLGVGFILSFPIRKFITKELPIGFGIGVGVGLAIARVDNLYYGQFNWLGFLAQTVDSGIHGLLGSIIYLVLRKCYRKIKFINIPNINESRKKYISYKFMIFIFLFVTFFGQVTKALMGISYS